MKTAWFAALGTALIAAMSASEAANAHHRNISRHAPGGYDSHGRAHDYTGAAYRYHYHGGRRYDAHCYDVYSDNYRYNGRPALFTGVECVDDYGCTWILEGSRQFVRYLGPSRRHHHHKYSYYGGHHDHRHGSGYRGRHYGHRH